MRIEKGKLYYDIIGEVFFKAESNSPLEPDLEIDWWRVSNKIAVHCPTKEDWEYVRCKYGLSEWDYHTDLEYCILDVESYRTYLQQCSGQGYHIITIDKFKEFYPDVENWEEKAKQEALKSVDDTAKATREAGCSEDMKKYIESFNYSSGIDNINPNHYTNKGIQPIDYIEANKLDFNEGNVIKYVTRYKDKNGLEDLKKAKFYIERLIEINKK